MLAALQSGFRPREERITVLIPSRMRLGAKWVDVVIHNVSSRGLMGGCDEPPTTGSYVEIRRGTIVIVGRVQWAKGRFFGVKSQDRLSVKALVDEPRLASRPPQKTDDAGERRAERRLTQEAQLARKVERSRAFASAFQFLMIAAAGITLAVIAAQGVYGVLSRPADAINAALAGK
ncbi:PilZ domain-containing protein [Sphingomonas sp. BK235]|uniref:PilZ domain-containing protein n=1 Tax=Sphingomonas sp. BK235 TaxID=2512131 RepID=UPI0010450F14|nr:PilZ domain-containing protein [Sphingomonas sp. BK235]TCP34057.1 hypothetical protein EV292_10447 [Sphingomonas sp. BK235]